MGNKVKNLKGPNTHLKTEKKKSGKSVNSNQAVSQELNGSK